MGTLGMIVRADCGGLGNQTWEIWRHVRPARTLVVTARGAARGGEYTDRYEGHEGVEFVAGLQISPSQLKRFAKRCTKVFTVETPYCANGFELIRAAGALGVLLANPELYAPTEHGLADLVRVPTAWATSRVPGCKVLAQPVAMDRFVHRARPSDGPLTFYHPVAPAMLDRNGTKTILDALRHVTEPCRVVFRSPGQPAPWGDDPSRLIGKVEALWLDQGTPMYWDAYPPEADVLLMPRRYGGLCLPVLEAAAQGIPALMTDLSPQACWPGVLRVAPSSEREHQMKGGLFPVWDTHADELAQAMDSMSRRPERVAELSDLAYEWAWANSWDELLPQWLGTLG